MLRRVESRVNLIQENRRGEVNQFYLFKDNFFFFIFVETQRDKQEAGSILMATGSLIKIYQKEIALHARGRTTTPLFFHFTFAPSAGEGQ